MHMMHVPVNIRPIQSMFHKTTQAYQLRTAQFQPDLGTSAKASLQHFLTPNLTMHAWHLHAKPDTC
jgi:hypothetical protein